MIALITGASSGIGRDMARYLGKQGYDLIITARNRAALEDLKEELEKENKIKVDVLPKDLSMEEDCKSLYEEVKQKYNNIDILINNAGFGLCGQFTQTDLGVELSMIDTNIKAVHILTKLFLKDMVEKNSGRIMNVASVAAFMPGPLMATYYSSKNYVLRLSQAINEELKKKKSNVKISVLCPGPVDTNFNDIANVKQFMFHSNKNAYSQLSDINQNNVFYAVNSFNTAAKDSQKGILEYLNDKKGFDPKELSKIIDSMLKMADANGIHKLSGDYIYLKSFSEECANSTKVTSGKAAQADESMVMLMRRMNDSLKLVDDKDITRMTDILVRKNVTGALGTGYNWQELQERQGKS